MAICDHPYHSEIGKEKKPYFYSLMTVPAVYTHAVDRIAHSEDFPVLIGSFSHQLIYQDHSLSIWCNCVLRVLGCWAGFLVEITEDLQLDVRYYLCLDRKHSRNNLYACGIIVGELRWMIFTPCQSDYPPPMLVIYVGICWVGIFIEASASDSISKPWVIWLLAELLLLELDMFW